MQALLLARANFDATTAFHNAVYYGHMPFIQALLEAGMYINFKDVCGRTALCEAVESSKIDVLFCLLEHDANIDERNMNGRTALHAAAQVDQVDLVSVLIAAGANIMRKPVVIGLHCSLQQEQVM